MRLKFVRFLVSVAVAGTAASMAASQDQDRLIYHAGTVTVPIHATVSGRDGRLATNLGVGDFSLRIDGHPKPITVFASESVPVSVAVLIDLSGSIRQTAPPREHFAERNYYVTRFRHMVGDLVADLTPRDRACVGLFGGRIGISPVIEGDKNALLHALDAQIAVAGSTPLWGSVDVAMDALEHESNRRAVVAFTDGFDTDSPIGYSDGMINRPQVQPPAEMVIVRAVHDDVMLYVICWRGLRFNDAIEPIARRLGGGYVVPGETDDVASVMQHVADELHHQYRIGFESAMDGKVHHIDLRAFEPGATVRTQPTYTAPRS